jgi:hypothetical protein
MQPLLGIKYVPPLSPRILRAKGESKCISAPEPGTILLWGPLPFAVRSHWHVFGQQISHISGRRKYGEAIRLFHPARGAAPAIGNAVGARAVPSHADEQAAIVAEVGRPPLLRIRHQGAQVVDDSVEIERDGDLVGSVVQPLGALRS